MRTIELCVEFHPKGILRNQIYYHIRYEWFGLKGQAKRIRWYVEL
jgi:hypothetical protein